MMIVSVDVSLSLNHTDACSTNWPLMVGKEALHGCKNLQFPSLKFIWLPDS